MCDKCAYVLPVAPTDPTTPVAPTDPTNPVAPTEPAPAQPSGNEAAGADLTWLWIVIAVVVCAGAATAGILLSKKKKAE